MSTKVKAAIYGFGTLILAGAFYMMGMVAQGDQQVAAAKAQLVPVVSSTAP